MRNGFAPRDRKSSPTGRWSDGTATPSPAWEVMTVAPIHRERRVREATGVESLDVGERGELDGWAGRDGRSVRTHFADRVTPIMFRGASYAAP